LKFELLDVLINIKRKYSIPIMHQLLFVLISSFIITFSALSDSDNRNEQLAFIKRNTQFLTKRESLEFTENTKRHSQSDEQVVFPTLAIPWPISPAANATLPSLVGKIGLITGCRGIALQVTLQSVALGATVVCTTRDTDTFDYTTVPSSVNVWALDWCDKKGVSKLRTKWTKHFGRNPDFVDDNALQVYNGDQIAFTDDELDCQADMYINGGIRLEREFMVFNNLSVPMAWNTALSTAAKGHPPMFQEWYNAGKEFKTDHILGRNIDQKYPNIRFTGVGCVFVNTTISATSYNPSANAGDIAQIEFQAVTQYFAGLIGVSPSIVATAHLQALFLPALFGGQTILQVPLTGGDGSDAFFYMATYLSPTEYKSNFSLYTLLNFGINVTLH